MNIRKPIALLVSFVLLAPGCANQAFSPPAGWIPMEEPNPLEPGRRTISGGIGFGDIGLDAADIYGGNIRYREGISELLELQVEGAAVVIDEETDEFPAILSARGGLKGLFVEDFPHLGWTAGLGFGGSAGGVFASADGGLQLGYVNRYLTPWIGAAGVVSVPLSSEDVDLKRPDDDEANIDHPVTSYGVRLSVGLSAHLGDSAARMHVVIANLKLYDIHGEDESITGASLGFDVPF